MGLRLRRYRSGDLDGLYAISLATGSLGEDAAALYDDPNLIGHIYSGPYAALSPQLCFVAEAGNGNIVGFAVGTDDTIAFETQLERDWWPALRQKYPIEEHNHRSDTRRDFSRIHSFHNPSHAPPSILSEYPAHVHVNLLPSARGQGVGSGLLTMWLSAAQKRGVIGVHIGVNRNNENGLHFWRSRGFIDLAVPCEETALRTCWLGLHTPRA